MRKLLCFICLLFLGFGNLVVAHAMLYDRSGGLIYDDALKITGIQNATLFATQDFGVSETNINGYVNWYPAKDWTDAMNPANHLGYSHRRLPDARNQDGSGPDYGPKVTTIEMRHMFYADLGRTYDSFPGIDFMDLLTDGTSSFQNLPLWGLWSDTEYESNPVYVWLFFIRSGFQHYFSKSEDLYEALAVQPEDSTPVPEPAIMLLLGTGLVIFAIIGQNKFKR